jgi:putative ABC transport system permease protein
MTLKDRVLGPILNPDRLEKELDAELRFDYEQRIAGNIRKGMSESEARRAARLEFGGLEQVKEACRDARSLQPIHSLLREIRHSLRAFRQAPGFTAVAVAILALGIGINAAVFTVTNAVLFKGFPLVERNDRLLYISNGGCCISYPDFADIRAQAKSFTGMGITHGIGSVINDNGGFPETIEITEVSADTFRTVGRTPMLGRDFMPADELPGGAPVAILSYAFWEHRYGKDPAVVGQILRRNGVPTTVIGVMPEGFSFPQKADMWVPLVETARVKRRENTDTWFAFGRLAEGVTFQSARAETEGIISRLEKAYPLADRRSHLVVQNFAQFFIGPNASLLYGSMWAAVGFVLLIACANLANLLLARAMGRSREVSVRIALGAGRWQIIRRLLIESVMLSGFGGFLGWWIAGWSVRAYQVAMVRKASWLILDYTMDHRVLAYLIGISIGTGLLFGLLPALRLSKLDVNAALKDGGRGATGGARVKQLSALLVTAEMALAIVLLAGAGVMIRSFLRVHNANIGIDTANVLVASVDLPAGKYNRPEDKISFYDRLTTRLEALPGVESATVGESLPTNNATKYAYELEGEPLPSGRRPTVWSLKIGPAYFRVLRAKLLSGRDFNNEDRPAGVPVAIVNHRFASRYWPGEDALGKRLRLFQDDTPGPWLTVIGVVSNIIQNDITRQRFDPLVYLPWHQKPEGGMWVYLRSRIPPERLTAAFRHEVQGIDPDLPMYGPFALAENLERYWDTRFYGVLFLILAAIALLLSSVGLYSVVAHAVSQRTQEIGIRMTVGATSADVLRLVLKQGMLPAGIGLTLGLAAWLAVNRALKSLLVRISPSDPVTIAAASAALMLAAILGCLIPAWRAMRTDPAVALRHE